MNKLRVSFFITFSLLIFPLISGGGGPFSGLLNGGTLDLTKLDLTLAVLNVRLTPRVENLLTHVFTFVDNLLVGHDLNQTAASLGDLVDSVSILYFKMKKQNVS